MLYFVYAIHIVICLFLIMVVLLQQGSGADLSVFGGGGTQTAFGARSATSLLHKLTVAGFVGFILTTMAFGFLKSGGSGGSVMTGIEQDAPTEAEPADAATGAEPEAANGEVDATSSEADTPSESDPLDSADDKDDSAEARTPAADDGP